MWKEGTQHRQFQSQSICVANDASGVLPSYLPAKSNALVIWDAQNIYILCTYVSKVAGSVRTNIVIKAGSSHHGMCAVDHRA